MINNPLVNLILCQYTDKKINLKVVFEVGVSEFFFLSKPLQPHTEVYTCQYLCNCCKAKSRFLTKSNHSVAPLRGTLAETLSVQLGEFIYLWQAHVYLTHWFCTAAKNLSNMLSCHRDTERETRQWERTRWVCTHGVCVVCKTYNPYAPSHTSKPQCTRVIPVVSHVSWEYKQRQNKSLSNNKLTL